MKISFRMMVITVACLLSNGLIAQTPAKDPVSLLEETAGRIFADVSENLEAYRANPEDLQTLVRRDLMPMLDVTYAARLVLGRAGRGLSQEKIDEFAI